MIIGVIVGCNKEKKRGGDEREEEGCKEGED